MPYHALPLDVQLNVDADTEAGAYQCMHPAQQPLIPRLPSNPAQLHIAGKVVCACIKQHIWEAATVPAYLEYLAARLKWDKHIAATMDWQAYSQAISRSPSN